MSPRKFGERKGIMGKKRPPYKRFTPRAPMKTPHFPWEKNPPGKPQVRPNKKRVLAHRKMVTKEYQRGGPKPPKQRILGKKIP